MHSAKVKPVRKLNRQRAQGRGLEWTSGSDFVGAAVKPF
jgi:hypothetical protein